MKVLCLATHPTESAATRYRLLQFFPYLKDQGIDASFVPFMDSRFYRDFYRSGRILSKALRLSGFALRRLGDVQKARKYDAVFIQREACLFGPPIIERMIHRFARKPIVFDFDDAIHLPSVSPTYGRLANFLKSPQKTPEIIRASRAVIAGNHNLEEYARTLNDNVSLIPTVVDAGIVKPVPKNAAANEPIVLGWIGTHSTYVYLENLFPVLQEVARKNSIIVRVVGAGRDVSIPGVTVDNRKWTLQTETEDLQSFDIGLYPIVEDPWALGKSGFKAIQYMAVGIPAVCSPVGATCDLIKDDVNGFLPNTPDEWQSRLEALISDATRRAQLGARGRKSVEDWYSLQQQAPRLKAILEGAVDGRR